MIEEKAFRQIAVQTKDSIQQGRVSDALALLRTLTTAVGDNRLSTARDTAEEDYGRLLGFMSQNVKDSSRREQHLRIVQSIIGTLQDTRRLHRLATSQDIYTTTWKQLPTPWDRGAQECFNEAMRRNKEERSNFADDCFNLVWTAPQLNVDGKRFLNGLLEGNSNGEHNVFELCLVSALTLALLEYFDPAKLETLLSLCHSQDVELRSRALVGACLASQTHSVFVPFYPHLLQSFAELNLNDELALVQHYFFICQERTNIHKTFKNEIMPNLFEAQDRRKKLGFDPIEIDLNEAAKALDPKKFKQLSKKFKELAQLFKDGVDLNMETFGSLKSFPFFREPGHWLAPFNEKLANDDMREALDNMHLCDSDKYSFCFFHNTLPKEHDLTIITGMQDGERTHSDKGKGQREAMEAYQNVVQCLSRLLCRSPWTTNWPGVFSPQMILINNPALRKTLIADSGYLMRTGETMLRYKRYEGAKAHFLPLLRREGSTARLLAALATCEEKLGNFGKTLDYLRQAVILAPGDRKLLEELQSCLATYGQPEERLEYLLELERLDPDNEKTLNNCGLCLMQLGRWKEAQQRFFKLEFSDRKVIPSLKAIAWCALQNGDLELARRYYMRLLEEQADNPQWEDYLNFGHTEWLRGNMQEALDNYHKYLILYKAETASSRDPLFPFDKDAPTLEKLGIDKEEICLMHDLLEQGL